MTILVTGAAGFIGSHVSLALLERGETVIGIDNLNDYYDVNLKKARLSRLESNSNFSFHKINIADKSAMNFFSPLACGGGRGGCEKGLEEITHIIHLAAQAGVRYSLENPFAYLESNITGQMVILEMCRQLPNLKHFVYASSSSVYGGNTKFPFSVSDKTDTPVSIYAATKKSCEILTHSYNHLYHIPCTGLRFFTVYGAWGRPDMAYFIFTKAIIEGKPINVFNNGDMRRDFTYIDDIVSGVLAAMDNSPTACGGGRGGCSSTTHKIYNLGNNQPVSVMEFINILENSIGKKAEMIMKPMEKGDVKETFADITESEKDLGFFPKITLNKGIPLFVEWYKEFY